MRQMIIRHKSDKHHYVEYFRYRTRTHALLFSLMLGFLVIIALFCDGQQQQRVTSTTSIFFFVSSFSPPQIFVSALSSSSSFVRRFRKTSEGFIKYSYPKTSTYRNSSNSNKNRISTSTVQQKQKQDKLFSNISSTSSSGSNPSPILGTPICVYHQVEIPTASSSETTTTTGTPPGKAAVGDGAVVQQLEEQPRQAIYVEDLTPVLQTLLEESHMTDGLLTVISRHTTTSITINEWEARLADDIAETFLDLIPPDERSVSLLARDGVRYKHNDIQFRPFGEEVDAGGSESDDSDTTNTIHYDKDSDEAQRCRENGWNVDDPDQLQAWRDQEPINSHSHLLSIIAGSGSESIPVSNSQLVLGQWQSVLLLDFDGPRNRTVGVQLMGYV